MGRDKYIDLDGFWSINSQGLQYQLCDYRKRKYDYSIVLNRLNISVSFVNEYSKYWHDERIFRVHWAKSKWNCFHLGSAYSTYNFQSDTGIIFGFLLDKRPKTIHCGEKFTFYGHAKNTVNEISYCGNFYSTLWYAAIADQRNRLLIIFALLIFTTSSKNHYITLWFWTLLTVHIGGRDLILFRRTIFCIILPIRISIFAQPLFRSHDGNYDSYVFSRKKADFHARFRSSTH